MCLAYVQGFPGPGTPGYFWPIFQKNPTKMKKMTRNKATLHFPMKFPNFPFNYYFLSNIDDNIF